MKHLIKEIEPYISLYKDSRTGLAWVENGKTGNEHSCHPNIDSTGSVKGMKKLGYWNKEDVTVKCNGSIYNVSSKVVSDTLDEIAEKYCQCEGCR